MITSNPALRWIERALLLGGVVLLAVLVYQLDARAVAANLRLVGWGILLILAQEIIAIVANTMGWWVGFPRHQARVTFASLLAARLAGDAVNYLTPTATLGGELVRTRMLRPFVDTTALVASLAVAKVSQTVAQVLFILIGLMLILDDTPLPDSVRHGIFLGFGAFCGVAVTLVLVQRRGMFAPLFRLLQRAGMLRHRNDLLQRLQQLDDEVARMHRHDHLALLASVGCFLAGWWAGVIEIYLILSFLGLPASVPLALAVEVLSVAIDGALFFVPMKAGTQEGGKVLIFTLLGLDPAKGLALGLLRRIRELFWAMIGLAIASRRLRSRR